MLLATNYLGLALKSPLVASASPLNSKLDNLRRLEDAGAAAIVLPSLFQEQIEAEAEIQASRVDAYANSSPEALTYFPMAASGPYGVHPERYLDLVRRGTEAVSIPIIASLNGSSRAGWIEYARLVEQAGAKALELNMYHVPTDLLESGRDIEARYIDIVQAVCGSIALPVSIKLTPYLSSIGHFAATLAASTGVSTVTDVVKYLLAGADVVMTTSALLRHEIEYMAALANGLSTWMREREIATIGEMRGMMSWQRSRDRGVYTRANYLRILEHYVDHRAQGQVAWLAPPRSMPSDTASPAVN